MTAELDTRLARLKEELDAHARIARYLGLDLDRLVQSLADGYPDHTIAQVGRITERLLHQLWIRHGAPGTPAGKALKDLISGCRPYIRSHRVLDALHEIQKLRNRSAHDGYLAADEDALVAIRRLLDVLAWYTSTGSGALATNAPRLSPAAAAKAEFLAGLYVTLDYRFTRRTELSQHAVYLLLVRERGLRSEYAELLFARDADQAAQALAASGGKLWQAGLTRLSRFVILEEDGGELPDKLRPGCQVVAYDHFMDVFVDLERHVADIARLYPALDMPAVPLEGDLLAVDERSGEMEVSTAGDARELLARVAEDGGNLLIMGGPGSGKTTLLKELVAAPPGISPRRYRFFFDLSLKNKDESFADFVTRTLAPCIRVEAAYVFPVFCYFTRTGSVLSALDGFDEAVPEMTLSGLLALFSEVAEVLSAESAVVMTSRVSFLEDSPPVRRLLDGASLMSEKLAQQLHSQGVDPLRVPRFSVLRLRDHGEVKRSAKPHIGRRPRRSRTFKILERSGCLKNQILARRRRPFDRKSCHAHIGPDLCDVLGNVRIADVAQIGGSVSGYHELMTSLTAQRSPATVRRTGSRAVFLYIADRVENSLFCRESRGGRPVAVTRDCDGRSPGIWSWLLGRDVNRQWPEVPRRFPGVAMRSA